MDAQSDQHLCYSQILKTGFLTSRLYILRGRGQIYFSCFVVVVFCILVYGMIDIDMVIPVNLCTVKSHPDNSNDLLQWK